MNPMATQPHPFVAKVNAIPLLITMMLPCVVLWLPAGACISILRPEPIPVAKNGITSGFAINVMGKAGVKVAYAFCEILGISLYPQHIAKLPTVM